MKKKKARVRKKRNSIKNRKAHSHILTLLIIIIIVVGFHFYKFIQNEIRFIVETPKSETRIVPQEVKNNITPNYSPAYRVPILMYHYVENVTDEKDTIRKSLNINPNIFESQVKTLYDAGYTFMTAEELGKVINGNELLPKRPVILTFDDGHWDLDTVVLPILKRYHAKATAYIIPGLLEGSDFLTDKQLKDVIDSKIVDVGAHTVHHVYLKGKLLPVVQHEVLESKRILEKTYGIRIVSFAYPDGAFDQQAIDVVKKAGFTSAVTTVPGIIQSKQNQFFIFRIRPGYKTGDELLNYLDQMEFKPF